MIGRSNVLRHHAYAGIRRCTFTNDNSINESTISVETPFLQIIFSVERMRACAGLAMNTNGYFNFYVALERSLSNY